MTESSNVIELIKYFLDRDSNEILSQCCICIKKVEKLYIICKPGCIKYSYCNKCISRIVNERKRCPFTNIEFNHKDVCLDYKINEHIEKQKSALINMKKLFESAFNL